MWMRVMEKKKGGRERRDLEKNEKEEGDEEKEKEK
jgi:hypothetical protein